MPWESLLKDLATKDRKRSLQEQSSRVVSLLAMTSIDKHFIKLLLIIAEFACFKHVNMLD